MHTTTSSATASSTTSSGDRATDHTIRYDTWIGYASHLSPKMWKDETGILFAIEEAKIDGDPSCRAEVNETMRAALTVNIQANRRGARFMHSPRLGGLRLRGAGSNASSSRTTTHASDASTAGTSAATTATAPAAAPSAAMSYLSLATNNLEAVLADEVGARCVACLGTPMITSQSETLDESTVVCTLCGVDAVVPASQVPDETTLKEWHIRGFSVPA